MRMMSRRMVLTAMMSAVALVGGGAVFPLQTQAAEKRVALHGYDPVAYFTDARPEKGSPRFTFAFDDSVYWFRDDQHRAMFAADPERYAPQYDGYCAVSMSAGMKAEPDPEAWAIAEGKLYVFGVKQAVAKFAQNRTGLVSQANANWQTLQNTR
jgi:hypothetical protein